MKPSSSKEEHRREGDGSGSEDSGDAASESVVNEDAVGGGGDSEELEEEEAIPVAKQARPRSQSGSAPPRPVKRLNLGRPGCGGAAAQQDTIEHGHQDGVGVRTLATMNQLDPRVVHAQAAEESRQRARAAEREASAALIEVEETLQRLVRSHRPGSPTVDHAVTELANRLNAYSQAREGSVQADTAYHEQHLQGVLQDRHRRWADHDERIQAARHPTVPVQQVQAGEGGVQQHPVPSRRDEGQQSSGGSDHDEGANESNAMVPQAQVLMTNLVRLAMTSKHPASNPVRLAANTNGLAKNPMQLTKTKLTFDPSGSFTTNWWCRVER
jgi:hypothetical protein